MTQLEGSSLDQFTETRHLPHTVHAGDTLFHVAQQYHVSVAQVASWNRLTKTRLVPGQKLVIRQGQGAR